MASKNSAFGEGHKGAGGTPVPTTETTPLEQGVSEAAATTTGGVKAGLTKTPSRTMSRAVPSGTTQSDPWENHPGKHVLNRDSDGDVVAPHRTIDPFDGTEINLSQKQIDQNEYATLHRTKEFEDKVAERQRSGVNLIREAQEATRQIAAQDYERQTPTLGRGRAAQKLAMKVKLTNKHAISAREAKQSIEAHAVGLIDHFNSIAPKMADIEKAGTNPDAVEAFKLADHHINQASLAHIDAANDFKGDMVNGAARTFDADGYVNLQKAAQHLLLAHHALNHPALKEVGIPEAPGYASLQGVGEKITATVKGLGFRKGRPDSTRIVNNVHLDRSDGATALKLFNFVERYARGEHAGIPSSMVERLTSPDTRTKRFQVREQDAREARGESRTLSYAGEDNPVTVKGVGNEDVPSDIEGRLGTGDWSGGSEPQGIPGRTPRRRDVQTPREAAQARPLVRESEARVKEQAAAAEAERLAREAAVVPTPPRAPDTGEDRARKSIEAVKAETRRREKLDRLAIESGNPTTDWDALDKDNADIAKENRDRKTAKDKAAEKDKEKAKSEVEANRLLNNKPKPGRPPVYITEKGKTTTDIVEGGGVLASPFETRNHWMENEEEAKKHDEAARAQKASTTPEPEESAPKVAKKPAKKPTTAAQRLRSRANRNLKPKE